MKLARGISVLGKITKMKLTITSIKIGMCLCIYVSMCIFNDLSIHPSIYRNERY
jgi:hypothetical protein